MRKHKKIGLSRRELEWTFQSMTRSAPSDPAALLKLVGDVVMTLIEKNNAAIARDLGDEGDAEHEGGGEGKA